MSILKSSLKVLQALTVVGLLAGCTDTASDSKAPMMGSGVNGMMCCMDMMQSMSHEQMKVMGTMSLEQMKMMQDMTPKQMEMMRNMSPEQLKAMKKKCMKMHKDMMGGKTMSMPSGQSSQQTDDMKANDHEKHHTQQ